MDRDDDRHPGGSPPDETTGEATGESPAPAPGDEPRAVEIGGPPGPEPTRYGDWERGGRCIDF